MEAKNIGQKYVATDNIFIDSIFNSEEDILSDFELKDVWECGECDETYINEEDAEECCKED